MILKHKVKDRFNKEELEWAISLMEKEYDRKLRNTPEKMAALIAENFDVKCSTHEILSFFGLEENYELESKIIEEYTNG
jgi:hypothetical protein